MRAKRVCAGCKVRLHCLRSNLTVPYGVFGGTTPLERMRILEATGKLPEGSIRIYGSASEALRSYQNRD